jgi:mono/diheme cytochrome c family protein
MKLWCAVSSVVFLGVAATAATPGDLAAGKKVYTGKCARCHKLYDPAKYDDKTWDSWMQKMKLKTKLTDDQYRRMSEYVTTLRLPR